ncbi:NADH-quinone oxidoreductase subunit J, partial [bacterium]|nr:NADH-quinone oxidoreductase subunit J [bacterium]
CLYIYLGADFVGISQVIIYVGGILVLLLFGVMFTRNMGRSLIKQTLQMKHGVAFLIFLFIGLLPVIYVTPWPILDDVSQKPIESTISAIGEMLLTKYLLPFEIASLLLLIALVGAMVLARTEPKTGEMDSSETDSLQGESE